MSEPTRHENILDLALINVLNLISDLQVQCPSTSDHNVVKCSINLCSDHNNVSDNHGVDEWYYDFFCGDYEAKESYLMNVNWSHEFTFVFNVVDYCKLLLII